MKTNKYVEDLKTKSAAQLAQDLVAAKKEHCKNSDSYYPEAERSLRLFLVNVKERRLKSWKEI